MASIGANKTWVLRLIPLLIVFLVCDASAANGQSKAASAAPSVTPSVTTSPAATFEELSTQAAAARESGRANDAIRLYRRALKLQPDWAEGWWYLGTLNYDADQYADAVAALQALIAMDSKMGPGLAFLGLSEYETKDYKNSLAHLQQAQQLGYGDDAELAKVATFHLALLYNWHGEFEKTLETLGPALQQKSPSDSIKVALGMAVLRIPLAVGDLDPGKDAFIHAAGEAAALLQRGDSEGAADAFRQLVRENPKVPYLHYEYAEALTRAGRTEEALGELAEEAKLFPQSALPHLRMASIHASAHRRQESAKELGTAKRLASSAAQIEQAQRQLYAVSRTGQIAGRQIANATDSDDSFETLAQKAAAAEAAGQMDPAASFCKRALALRPQWEEGWRNLGTLYYAAARYAEAVVALKNAAALDARNGNVWALLGLSEFETKDYKNSLIHLERGRDIGFAGNAAAVQVARYHLAILLNRNGDFDRATELLTTEAASGPLQDQVKIALGMAMLRLQRLPDELDRSDDAVLRNAGNTAALLAQSKYDEAFSKFQQMLATNSYTPYLHYAYGSALASASRYDEADEQLAEETKITPGSALPFLRRGTIALQLHHADIAQQFAERAAQLAPESAESHYLLGRSWLELGKTVDAVKQLEVARGLAPNSPEVHFNLARAYTKAGRAEEAEKERAAFERLNALVQSQRGQSGSQAYGAIQDKNGIRAVETEIPNNSATEARPE